MNSCGWNIYWFDGCVYILFKNKFGGLVVSCIDSEYLFWYFCYDVGMNFLL